MTTMLEEVISALPTRVRAMRAPPSFLKCEVCWRHKERCLPHPEIAGTCLYCYEKNYACSALVRNPNSKRQRLEPVATPKTEGGHQGAGNGHANVSVPSAFPSVAAPIRPLLINGDQGIKRPWASAFTIPISGEVTAGLQWGPDGLANITNIDFQEGASSSVYNNDAGFSMSPKYPLEFLDFDAIMRSTSMQAQHRLQPLVQAAGNGSLEIVQMLLDCRAEVNAEDSDGTNALWTAANEGHYEICKLLLERGANVHCREVKTGRQALHQAAQGGYPDIVEMLIAAHADVNAMETDGATPLWLAAQDGNLTVVKMLLKADAMPNRSSESANRTALHQAAQNAHDRVVEALLKCNDIDFDLQAEDGVTALWLAAQAGCEPAVNLLIGKGARIDVQETSDARQPMHQAALCGSPAIVEALLQAGASVNCTTSDGVTPLWLAAQKGCKDTVRLLLNSKARVGAARTGFLRQAIHQAAQNGHREVVQLLIEHGAPVDCHSKDGITPLFLAAHNGSKETVQLLLDHNARVDACDQEDMWQPIHHAAQNGHEAVVDQLAKALIDIKAPIDCLTKPGVTALWLAAQNGHTETIRVLLSHGASFSPVDNEGGFQAIHQAAQNGKSEVVGVLARALIESGSTVDCLTRSGVTPLWLAAQNGHRDTVSELLKQGASPTAHRPESLRQPLHQAAQQGHFEVVKLLVKALASIDRGVDCKDSDSITPLWLASTNGHDKVVKLLLEEGARPDTADPEDLFQPLHQAAQEGHLGIVRLIADALVKANEPIDCLADTGVTPLWLAAQNGHDKVVLELVNRGASVDICEDEDSRSPVYQATQNGHLKVVDILLDAGASADSKASDGVTPLWMASQSGYHEIVDLLLTQNVDVNAVRTGSLRRPIHQAAQKGHTAIVRALVNANADKNANDADGITPTMLAASCDTPETLHILLEARSNFDAISTKGSTALSIACGFQRVACVKALLEAGAQREVPLVPAERFDGFDLSSDMTLSK